MYRLRFRWLRILARHWAITFYMAVPRAISVCSIPASPREHSFKCTLSRDIYCFVDEISVCPSTCATVVTGMPATTMLVPAEGYRYWKTGLCNVHDRCCYRNAEYWYCWTPVFMPATTMLVPAARLKSWKGRFFNPAMSLAWLNALYMHLRPAYCSKFHPYIRTLTSSLVTGWIQYEIKSNRHCIANKCAAIRSFAKYLGGDAYVLAKNKAGSLRKKWISTFFQNVSSSK